MAQITKAIQQEHRLVANLIPADVLAAIGQDELYDRLIHAKGLVRKAQAATDPTLRRGYTAVAKAVLAAQPRAATERQVTERISKAAGLGNTAQADALRRQAQELLERHPPAPRRADHPAVAVAKAKADPVKGLVLIYDAAGNPVGLCDPEKIQTVSGPEGIAKARAAMGKARRPVQMTRRSPGRR